MIRSAVLVSGKGTKLQSLLDSVFFGEIPELQLVAVISSDANAYALKRARNAGIDAAKGRYYSFIDSDDVVLPRFLQTLYDACEEHDAYMSLCSVEDVQEDGKSCDPAYFTRPTQEGVFCGKDLLNEFYTPYGTVYTVAWNKMYRAEVWKLLHYPEGRLHEDDFVAHRLFWRCDKVVCIDKPL